jgi:hypothetical protein
MPYRVKIHNRTTGERYEFTTEDPATVDARLAEHPCYGTPEEREVVITDRTPDALYARKEAEYEKAKKLALDAIDIDARFKYNIWLIDPTASAAKKAAIWEVYAWTDALWQEYAVVRARILAGDTSAVFSFATPCPYNFWQVAAL